MPKILIVATGIGAYANAILPTGLWLSELTHIYHRAKGLGCKITIASPKGGEIPVDPESLKPFTLDKVLPALPPRRTIPQAAHRFYNFVFCACDKHLRLPCCKRAYSPTACRIARAS